MGGRENAFFGSDCRLRGVASPRRKKTASLRARKERGLGRAEPPATGQPPLPGGLQSLCSWLSCVPIINLTLYKQDFKIKPNFSLK